MELDQSNMQLPLFSDTSPALVSFHDYIKSIHIPGGFNWQAALRTLLMYAKMPLLLPMTDWVPSGVGDGTSKDPLEAMGGSQLVFSVLKQIASPLFLYSFAEFVNLVSSQTVARTLPDRRATAAFALGSWDRSLAAVDALPNPFILDTHLPALLDGLDPDAPPHIDAGSQTFDWLPDVSMNHVGRESFLNEYSDRLSHVLAVLMNRLAANWMPEGWRTAAAELPGRTVVQLSSSSEPIDTPDGLLRALEEELGADLEILVVSRITGFGLGMSVRNGEAWCNTPLVFPVRTGIVLVNSVAKSSGGDEIVTLFSHAELAVRATSSKLGPFRLGFYLGIGGFTGWQPGNEAVQPWNNGAHTEVRHCQDWGREERFEAVRLCSAVAAIMNKMADNMQLPLGGYGFLGVCNDTVAMVQAALGRPVTMFPCLSAGRVKTVMAQMCREYAAAHAHGSTMHKVAEQVRRGLLRLPCDVVHEPAVMLDAVRRVEQQMPPVSLFKTLEAARLDLQEARKQLAAQEGPEHDKPDL